MCVHFFFSFSSFYLHPEHGGLRAVGRHLLLFLLLQLRLLLGNPFQPGKGWLGAGRHRAVCPPPRAHLALGGEAQAWEGVGRPGGQVGRPVWVSANRRDEVPPFPSTSSPVSRGCPPVPNLPLTPPPPPTSQPSRNPRKRQDLARYPEQLQAKPGNSSATFPKSPRAPRPCAPGACPPSGCAEGLRSCESPATCCFPLHSPWAPSHLFP